MPKSSGSLVAIFQEEIIALIKVSNNSYTRHIYITRSKKTKSQDRRGTQLLSTSPNDHWEMSQKLRVIAKLIWLPSSETASLRARTKGRCSSV